KSTLVNRIVGRRVAVVEERPGVTRDRKELEADWGGRPFTVVDTGGWSASGGSLEAQVRAQAERAVVEADVVLLVVDGTVGVVGEDLAVARLLQRSGKPVLVVVNKVDSSGRELEAWSAVSLGLGDPWPVSALHGRGTGDLLDEVVRRLPPEELAGVEDAAPDAAGRRSGGTADHEAGAATPSDPRSEIPRVALVGRPNVGKSTLFNRLVGDERAVVHDAPGTTRDTVDTVVATPEGEVCFVDTAGMRRPSRTERGTEYFAVLRALEAVDRADIVLLVVDATAGITHQDQRLAERVAAAGSPTVVVLNKWDVLPPDQREQVLADVGDRLAFLGEAPVLRVSGRTGLGVHRLLPAVVAAEVAYHRRIPTGELNRAVRAIQSAHPAPRARVRYAVQGATDPPTFTLFTNGRLPPTYLRYLERGLRERFDLGPTPLKIRVRDGRQTGLERGSRRGGAGSRS
ncbi:MAG TPA: ribosome biogenesis GTPase Der, partial [Acidimicrobiales bacterium]|nr:ribosome biogenesis GTPase Der [Acidimicrobiales bacterium]